MRTVFLFWRNGHDLKSALFFRFEQNLRPVSRFWKLWRSKMRFGQSLLRMTWKEHFVQFSWKAHCFSALKRIWGQFHDFENFDAQKCDLAKTCCAWPEKSVLYTFHGKRTVFQFWREFEASSTILRTLALKNQIWPKRAAHDLKSGFCTIFLEAHCFSVLKRISGQFYNFENFDPQKCDLAKTCCAWPEKSVLYNFHEKRTVFQFCREFQASVTILKIWRFEMRFGQNVLRMTWNERFVQFSWKAHCFLVLERISGARDDFENIDAPKCDLTKTCCAWPEKSVLDNFHEKRTVFPIWREFQVSVTILRTLTLKNAHCFFCFEEMHMTWKAHSFPDLKRIWGQFQDFENFDAIKCDLAKTCCAWPEKSVLNNFHGERTVFQFWREFQASVTILKICRSKMRFGQNVLRMTWKERFVQFSWKAHCFPDLKRISGKCDDFKNFDAQKCALFFLFWRNAHDLKSALFSRFEENLRPVSGYRKVWRYKMRFGKNLLRMTWKEGFVQFSWKAHCFPVLAKIWGQFHDFENFGAKKSDLAKTCCAWPEKRVW